MITFKQQLLLDQLRSNHPDLFAHFDIQIPQSPEFSTSIAVALRVQAIVEGISNQEVIPRSVPRETSYHQSVINLFTRHYQVTRDANGIICPF